jgi:hypothetical protein
MTQKVSCRNRVAEEREVVIALNTVNVITGMNSFIRSVYGYELDLG